MSGLVNASELHGHAQTVIPMYEAPSKISISGSRGVNSQEPFAGSWYATVDEGSVLRFAFDDVKRSTLRGVVTARNGGKDVGLSVTHENLPHTWTLDTSDKAITYGYAIKCLQGSIKTQPLDGFPSSVSFATKITQGYFGAFTFDYDPFRSGLKSYTYGVLALAPRYFPKGDLSVTVQNPHKVTFAASRKVAERFKVHGIFTNSRSFYVGASYNSPCGGVLSLSGRPLDEVVSIYVSKKFRNLFTLSLWFSWVWDADWIFVGGEGPGAGLSITFE